MHARLRFHAALSGGYMAIDSVVGTGIQTQQTVDRPSSGKLKSVIDTLISKSTRPVDAVEQQSTASKLQSRESGFKQASADLAEASSLVQTAREGAREIRDAFEDLRSKKTDLPQTQEMVDRIVKETSFEDKPLLDGSLKVSLEETLSGTGGSENDITLAVDDLSAERLLKDDKPETVDRAVRTVEKVIVDTETFQQAVGIVAASVDTAAANQQAAQSELQESDFDNGTLKDVQQNPSIAVAAQSNQLNPALVKLVN